MINLPAKDLLITSFFSPSTAVNVDYANNDNESNDLGSSTHLLSNALNQSTAFILVNYDAHQETFNKLENKLSIANKCHESKNAIIKNLNSILQQRDK